MVVPDHALMIVHGGVARGSRPHDAPKLDALRARETGESKGKFETATSELASVTATGNMERTEAALKQDETEVSANIPRAGRLSPNMAATRTFCRDRNE